jgi:hypothetical protein
LHRLRDVTSAELSRQGLNLIRDKLKPAASVMGIHYLALQFRTRNAASSGAELSHILHGSENKFQTLVRPPEVQCCAGECSFRSCILLRCLWRCCCSSLTPKRKLSRQVHFLHESFLLPHVLVVLRCSSEHEVHETCRRRLAPQQCAYNAPSASAVSRMNIHSYVYIQGLFYTHFRRRGHEDMHCCQQLQ